ncbi:MAG TPA: hypothetical protein VLT59_10080, partial [Steroidobacteraceae bacterium]|nr:hypothetical protein [Steroidobacteraceae bacterium]
FDGNPRDVTVVGYQAGHGGQWIKAKSYALADAIRTPDALDEVPKVLWPDPVPQPIISGAPVIDPASGAVIGLHQGSNGATDGNMLVIDEWLARAILSYTRSTDPSGS